MSEEKWRPLSVRKDPKAIENYDALHEGVPEWMKNSLIDWIRGHTEKFYGEAMRNKFELALRRSIPGNSQALYATLCGDDELALDVAEYLLGQPTVPASTLEDILRKGGSAWRVNAAWTPPRLERRVDETTTNEALKQMEPEDDASKYLRDAWHACYGRNPDPSKAYSAAIKAVECAAHWKVEANNKGATLGKMIAELDTKPGKWSLELAPGSDEQVKWLAGMCRLLWKGQQDRHGSRFENVPITQEQAETGVSLAVTLVGIFRGPTFKVKE